MSKNTLHIEREKPLYIKVYDMVFRWARNLPIGTQLSGERELAERFNVSRQTIRTAIKKLREYGYIESHHGKGNFISKIVPSKTISVLYYSTNFQNSIYYRVYTLVEKEIENTPHHLQLIENVNEAICISNSDIGINSTVTDAWLTIGVMDANLIRNLSNTGKPVVTIDFEAMSMIADSIILDIYHAGRTLTDHLIRMGHRFIGFIGENRGIQNGHPLPEADSLHMHAGVVMEGMLNGLTINQEWDWTLPDENFSMGDVVTKYKKSISRPTAFILFSSYKAVELIREFDKAQIRVPEDISVACFSQLNEHMDSCPELTAYESDIADLAAPAVRILLSRLSGYDGKAVRKCVSGNLKTGSTASAPTLKLRPNPSAQEEQRS